MGDPHSCTASVLLCGAIVSKSILLFILSILYYVFVNSITHTKLSFLPEIEVDTDDSSIRFLHCYDNTIDLVNKGENYNVYILFENQCDLVLKYMNKEKVMVKC